MVFVWSQLCKGDPYFTLSQVALNDAIMIIAFAPLVALLLRVVHLGPLGHAADLSGALHHCPGDHRAGVAQGAPRSPSRP
jgi:hypothetical protein